MPSNSSIRKNPRLRFGFVFDKILATLLLHNVDGFMFNLEMETTLVERSAETRTGNVHA